MSSTHAVCLVGFSDFERQALGRQLAVARPRLPAYRVVKQIGDAGFLVVDGASRVAVEHAERAGRVADSVYVGGQAPEAALARVPRPIDPRLLLRELDAAVQMQLHPVAGRRLPPADDEPASTRPMPRATTAPFELSELADLFPDRLDPPAATTPTDTGPEALLVDDSEIALRYLKMRLAELGIRSHAVRDSDAAQRALAEHRYRLVFVDVELGEASALDGLALCQQIKRSGAAATPIVAIVSAHAGATDRVRGSLAGCDAYLGKPLAATELAAVVARLRKPAAAG